MARLPSPPSRFATLPAKVAVPPKTPAPLYTSPEWRALVASIKRQRGNRCEIPGCTQPGPYIGDHIVEVRDGGPKLDPVNVRLLCRAHHNAKTAEAKAARFGRAAAPPGGASKL